MLGWSYFSPMHKEPFQKRASFQIALILALTLGTAKIHAAALTGAVVFSVAATGDAAMGQIWDTGSDLTLARVFLSVLTPTGYVAINGPDGSQGALSFFLRPGTNVFRLVGQNAQTANFSVFGLNLFLDGHLLPGISITGSLGGATLSSNSASNTLAPNGVTVPATGTFVYDNGVEYSEGDGKSGHGRSGFRILGPFQNSPPCFLSFCSRISDFGSYFISNDDSILWVKQKVFHKARWTPKLQDKHRLEQMGERPGNRYAVSEQ